MPDTARGLPALSLRWKLTLAIILFGAVITGTLSCVSFTATRSQMREDFRQRLKDIVGVGALHVDAAIHHSLQHPSQEGSTAYLAVKQALQRIQANAEDIHFVYTMRSDAKDRIAFVVDAETNPAEIAHLGDIYTDASPFLSANFHKIHEPVVEGDFYTDHWGTWLTGYAPIFDSRHQRVGVLGVDIQASRILNYEKRLLLLFTAIFCASILMSTLLGVFLGNRLTAPLLALRKSAECIGSGDFDTTVPVQSHDELGVLAHTFNIMSQKLKDLVRRLHEEIASREAAEKKYRSIFDNAMEGIFQSTLDGRLLTANPELANMLGYESSQEAVANLQDISRQLYARPEQRREVLERLQSEGRVPNVRVKIRKKDGQEIWAELTARIIRENGAPPVIEGLLKDVSEQLAKEAAEREQQAAQAASTAKSEFLANMSHEIRTPMNAVIGLTYLALKTDLTSQQTDYLEKILRSARTLLRIINDILDFSKIEAGKMSIETVAFDLETIMHNLADVLGLKAEEKGLEMLFRIGADVPHRLLGDPLRLEQILTNLANNAVKFTEKGNILVAVQVEPEAEFAACDRVRLKFSVSDTGIGLSPAKVEGLFRSFSQADDSITRKYGGTGLGLAICKRLVELMDGRIWAESSPGQGSTFIFTAAFAVQAEESAPKFQYPDDLRGLKVLVVDDNSTARDIVCEILESFSFRAHQAPSGEEALADLEAAQKSDDPYELVIIDWKMPGMDGIEAAQAIRSRENLAHVPAIMMLTAYSRDEIRRDATATGVEGFLLKPVNPSLLFDAILSVFNRTTGIQASPACVGQSPIKGLEKIRGARILLVEDNEINRQVAVELLSAEGFAVETAVNGRVAVERLSARNPDEKFDAVLMDIQMPEMDGITATRKIREMPPEMGALPIIAMTAHALESEKEKCSAAGMNDHVAKPVDPAVLFRTLVKWITPNGRRPALDMPAKEPQPADSPHLPASLPGFDLSAGLSRVAGNPNVYLNLLRQFARTQADTAQRIADLIGQGEFNRAKALAHTVKGVAGNLGADGLHRAAGALEASLKHGATESLTSLNAAFNQALHGAVTAVESLADADRPQPAAQTPTESPPPADGETIAELIRQLYDLIQSDYGAALEKAALLSGMVQAADARPLVDDLMAHLDAFEEASALNRLREIADCLTVPLGAP